MYDFLFIGTATPDLAKALSTPLIICSTHIYLALLFKNNCSWWPGNWLIWSSNLSFSLALITIFLTPLIVLVPPSFLCFLTALVKCNLGILVLSNKLSFANALASLGLQAVSNIIIQSNLTSGLVILSTIFSIKSIGYFSKSNKSWLSLALNTFFK